MRAAVAPVVAGTCALALLFVGCAGGSVPETPIEEPTVTAAPEAPVEEPVVTKGTIVAWAENAEWSFAADGLWEPETVALQDGEGDDEYLRTYTLGEAVEGDADGDGVVDVVIPITQLDGNAMHVLWYVWLGRDDAASGEQPADQLVYPIARMSRCGDIVHEVTALDVGFRIEQTLWMPHTDAGRDCASGGTGEQTRDVVVSEIDGDPYPIQVAPLEAWGGVCPRSEWLDGILDEGFDIRAAAAASAPVVVDASETVGLYELPEAPLLTAGGQRFFGFQTEELMADSENPIRMHCGFYG